MEIHLLGPVEHWHHQRLHPLEEDEPASPVLRPKENLQAVPVRRQRKADTSKAVLAALRAKFTYLAALGHSIDEDRFD